MARLNQIIAVEKGIKSQSLQELAATQQALQKPALLAGLKQFLSPNKTQAAMCNANTSS